MMKHFLIYSVVVGLACAGVNSGVQAAELSALQQEAIGILLATPDVITDSNAEQTYRNNVNSARENQNKIQMNAATRAVALGERAVALATQGSKGVEQARKDIENQKDILNMLKQIAKLQAQSLQKTNQITALRVKMVELNAMDSVITGDVITKNEEALKQAAAKK